MSMDAFDDNASIATVGTANRMSDDDEVNVDNTGDEPTQTEICEWCDGVRISFRLFTFSRHLAHSYEPLASLSHVFSLWLVISSLFPLVLPPRLVVKSV